MSFAVIKIGGCNGSGKTTLMRAVLSHIGVKPEAGAGKVNFYRQPYDAATAYVLGDYAPHRACGGMDTISDKNTRYGLVKTYAKNGNLVLFEGLITGKTYGALGALSEEPEQMGRWLYVFMDTPFDVCVERVLARRAAAGNTSPFDPERTMWPTYRSVHSTAARAADRGHPVYCIDHTDKPHTAAKKLLNTALEVYHA